MTNVNIISYSPSLKRDNEIVAFIKKILLDEYKQPKNVQRKDLDNLEFYSKKDSKLFLLINDKIIVGTIGVFKKNNIAVIKRFYLRKNIRGKGLGKLLFKHASEFAKSLNVDNLELNCDSRKMRKAYAFYLKSGFKVIEARSDGYVVMRKEVDG